MFVNKFEDALSSAFNYPRLGYSRNLARSIMKFSHLHVHTQFSLLDGAASIQKLYKKRSPIGMPALAISDHGNMCGCVEL